MVNRAFRATARRILEGVVSPGTTSPPCRTGRSRRAALVRLAELGMDGSRAEGLLDLEPGLGDRWLAYLARCRLR